MIVEFIGLPGTGKTTMTLALAERFPGFTIPPKYPGKHYALLFVCMHPLYSALWFGALLWEGSRTGTLSLTRYKVAGFTYTCARYQYAQSMYKRGEKVLLDEGMAQRFLSLYERPRPVEVFLRWLPHLPQTDAILSLEGQPYDLHKSSPLRLRRGSGYMHHHRDALVRNQQALCEALRRTGTKLYSCAGGDSCIQVFADKIAL